MKTDKLEIAIRIGFFIAGIVLLAIAVLYFWKTFGVFGNNLLMTIILLLAAKWMIVESLSRENTK